MTLARNIFDIHRPLTSFVGNSVSSASRSMECFWPRCGSSIKAVAVEVVVEIGLCNGDVGGVGMDGNGDGDGDGVYNAGECCGDMSSFGLAGIDLPVPEEGFLPANLTCNARRPPCIVTIPFTDKRALSAMSRLAYVTNAEPFELPSACRIKNTSCGQRPSDSNAHNSHLNNRRVGPK